MHWSIYHYWIDGNWNVDSVEHDDPIEAERIARAHAKSLAAKPGIDWVELRLTDFRHTPEGTQFSQDAMADVRGTVRRRDAPFGDYGEGPRTA